MIISNGGRDRGGKLVTVKISLYTDFCLLFSLSYGRIRCIGHTHRERGGSAVEITWIAFIVIGQVSFDFSSLGSVGGGPSKERREGKLGGGLMWKYYRGEARVT